MQAALTGALEAAQRPASASAPSRGFESRLIDEYLKASQLQTDCSAVVASGPTPTGPGTGGPEGTVPLPLIQEDVEDVDEGEGMDGEKPCTWTLLMLLRGTTEGYHRIDPN